MKPYTVIFNQGTYVRKDHGVIGRHKSGMNWDYIKHEIRTKKYIDDIENPMIRKIAKRLIRLGRTI